MVVREIPHDDELLFYLLHHLGLLLPHHLDRVVLPGFDFLAQVHHRFGAFIEFSNDFIERLKALVGEYFAALEHVEVLVELPDVETGLAARAEGDCRLFLFLLGAVGQILGGGVILGNELGVCGDFDFEIGSHFLPIIPDFSRTERVHTADF